METKNQQSGSILDKNNEAFPYLSDTFNELGKCWQNGFKWKNINILESGEYVGNKGKFQIM